MPKEVSIERLLKDARRVLENSYWIPYLDPKETYARLHDDHDGSRKGWLMVSFNELGDVYVETKGDRPLRFRTGELGGGGASSRTRNALMLLAWAIKLDNEEKIPK